MDESTKGGSDTAMGGIDMYSTSADSCFKGAKGNYIEDVSGCVYTIRNKNGTFPDFEKLMAMLGAWSGLFVGIICGPGE